MALFQSGIVTAASGSMGGLTFSHNRGGMYVRARVVPTNPNTGPQNLVRAAMAFLTNRWANTLTQVQRDAWDVYSENVPLPGPLGDPRNVGGLGMYVRSNLHSVAIGGAFADDAPIIFDTGGYTPVTAPTATSAGALIGFAFTNTDDWANEDGSVMFVFGSRPQNLAIKYFTGPYQYIGLISGDAIVPPVSPASIANAFPFAVGQRVFFRVLVRRVDGRYSNTQRLTAIGV